VSEFLWIVLSASFNLHALAVFN